MANEYLTTRQLADRLGLQPQTIRLWRLRGNGPAYLRLGGGKFARVAYRVSAVEAWEQERTFTSTSAESASVGAA